MGISASFGYITGIQLNNIRSFKDIYINLKTDTGQRMLSVIIGRNGTCKSTLLRCIAIGLSHQSDASAMLADSSGGMVAENKSDAFIKLEMADIQGNPMGYTTLTIKNESGRDTLADRYSTISAEEFFVCGYGSCRGNIGESKMYNYRVKDATGTLFDYRRNLVAVELMLRRLEDFMGTERYERAQKGIKRVLGLGPKHHIGYAKGGGVIVSGPGIGDNIPLEGWADGYRMTFNWIIDLYGWAMQADAITESGGIRGILLVDEIDQNLHPAMQTTLLSDLAKSLPEMQIFVTSHNPLTALGTVSENVIALHRERNIIKRMPVPSLTGYSADDALVEEALFGTDPFPKQTRKKIIRYRELSAIPPTKRTTRNLSEMKSLAVDIDPEKLPGLRDDPLAKKLDAIAEMLKKEKK